MVKLGFVLVLLSLFLGGRWGWLPQAAGTDEGRYHDKIFTVVNVVDGDTFDIDAPDGREEVTRIRLWGVDTPETKDPERGVMYYGPEATAFTREMVLGKQVRVVLEPFEESRGLYGRLLAYVYLEDGNEESQESRVESRESDKEIIGGAVSEDAGKMPAVQRGYVMLNEELIREGYGYADDRFRHMLRDRFGKLQEEARAEKRGLWAEVRPEDWPEWYRNRQESIK